MAGNETNDSSTDTGAVRRTPLIARWWFGSLVVVVFGAGMWFCAWCHLLMTSDGDRLEANVANSNLFTAGKLLVWMGLPFGAWWAERSLMRALSTLVIAFFLSSLSIPVHVMTRQRVKELLEQDLYYRFSSRSWEFGLFIAATALGAIWVYCRPLKASDDEPS